MTIEIVVNLEVAYSKKDATNLDYKVNTIRFFNSKTVSIMNNINIAI